MLYPLLHPRTFDGKNSQTPLFFEIISVLLLFEKYSTMYYFFETRVYETRVELEFKKIEYHKNATR